MSSELDQLAARLEHRIKTTQIFLDQLPDFEEGRERRSNSLEAALRRAKQ